MAGSSSAANWSVEQNDEWLMGFSVAPNPNCPHLSSPTFQVASILTPSPASSSLSEGKARRRNLFLEHRACHTCGDDTESWVCLGCGYSGCSRYRRSHMVEHAREKREEGGHMIGLGLADLSVWCFECEEYVTHAKVEGVFREMHWGKFGCWPGGELHGGVAEMGNGVLLEMQSATTGKRSTEEGDASQDGAISK
eukprot:GFKZ01006880.1.p1 GENE.GFKZ01006880.1~~GFKZ01006880.1.p1  ORF type:complete len:195 (+),score=16.13 GFKZ01006880.1:383-967(+)